MIIKRIIKLILQLLLMLYVLIFIFIIPPEISTWDLIKIHLILFLICIIIIKAIKTLISIVKSNIF